MNTQNARLDIDGYVPATEPAVNTISESTDNMSIIGRINTEAYDPFDVRVASEDPTTMFNGVRLKAYVSEKMSVCTTRKDGTKCPPYLTPHPHYLASLEDSYAYIRNASDTTYDFDVSEETIARACELMNDLCIIEHNLTSGSSDIYAANRYYTELSRVNDLMYRAASAEFEAAGMRARDEDKGNNSDTLADRDPNYTKKIEFMETNQRLAYLGYRVLVYTWPGAAAAINWSSKVKSGAFTESSRLRDTITKADTSTTPEARAARLAMAKKMLRRAT